MTASKLKLILAAALAFAPVPAFAQRAPSALAQRLLCDGPVAIIPDDDPGLALVPNGTLDERKEALAFMRGESCGPDDIGYRIPPPDWDTGDTCAKDVTTEGRPMTDREAYLFCQRLERRIHWITLEDICPAAEEDDTPTVTDEAGDEMACPIETRR